MEAVMKIFFLTLSALGIIVTLGSNDGVFGVTPKTANSIPHPQQIVPVRGGHGAEGGRRVGVHAGHERLDRPRQGGKNVYIQENVEIGTGVYNTPTCDKYGTNGSCVLPGT